MTLFIVFIVGIVVAQTWHDWRKGSKDWVLPEWAKGVALGGVMAVCLAAATSFASAWIEDPASQWAVDLVSRTLWPEASLVLLGIAVIVFMIRKRRIPWVLVLGGLALAAMWLGMAFGS